MKKLSLITIVLAVMSSNAMAEQITLTLDDYIISGNTKYCYYSNANYDFTYEVGKNSQCPYTRTFSVEDEE